mmetsp:Transcript_33031/g.65652  ORF Transcript_33031/g.65652 Transcript_33031/m.65652 type:complete len:107 (-) Transcript_33031:942-1262(-)
MGGVARGKKCTFAKIRQERIFNIIIVSHKPAQIFYSSIASRSPNKKSRTTHHPNKKHTCPFSINQHSLQRSYQSSYSMSSDIFKFNCENHRRKAPSKISVNVYPDG